MALGPEQTLFPCTLPDDGSAAGGGGLRGLIICGAWLVRGPKGRKQKPQNDAEDADFTEYTAQDAQAEPEARGFAMPKLSALLGKPVTPDDETEDADDGRDEK